MKQLLLIVLLFSISSCSFHKLCKNPESNYWQRFQLTSGQETQKIISLQRTSCFGTCPIYKIIILSDGSAKYEGVKFVDKKGVVNFTLTEEQIKSIFKKANEIEYFKLKDQYIEKISDLPTTYIQILDKQIKDYAGAPKELKELEKLIDKICFQYIK